MTRIRADPAKTHALVVGIERYEMEDSDLDGPALDARDFRDYLAEVGVPVAQILLLLSPIEKNRQVLECPESPVGNATRQRVGEAIRQLQDRKGELLIVYWAGHGMSNLEGERRLFYADARDNDRRNLNLKSLLVSLSTSAFPGFQRHLVFVDACANYEEDWDREYSNPGETFATGDREETSQFVLYAAKLGQVAGNLQSRGLFFGKLLPRLKARRGWPPDMENIAGELRQEFDNAGIPQRPAYYLKNWDEDERDKDPLAGAECSLIEREQATGLLHRARKFEIEPKKLRQIYRTYAPRSPLFALEPEGAEPEGDTLLRSLILRLSTAAMSREGSHPLLRFAMNLELEAPDSADLINWIDEFARDLGIYQEALERLRQEIVQRAADQPVLLVIVAPPRPTTMAPDPAADTFDVRAGLIMEPCTATDWKELEIRWLNPRGERYRLEELKSQIHLWAAECPGELRVEVFLPERLLDVGVDQWRPPSRVRKPPLGRTHRVIVRSWDRTYDATNPEYTVTLASWRRNWECLDRCQRQSADLPAHVFQAEDFGDDGEAFQNKVDEGRVCVAIERKPVVDPPVEAQVWLSGTPIALWRRGEPSDREAATKWREWLDRLMALKVAREWASSTHVARRASDHAFGSEITLLYDNPCKLPLDAPANGRLRQPTRFS